jgi:hypothetical protein
MRNAENLASANEAAERERKKWEARDEARRENAYQFSGKMRTKALTMLDFPLSKMTKETKNAAASPGPCSLKAHNAIFTTSTPQVLRLAPLPYSNGYSTDGHATTTKRTTPFFQHFLRPELAGRRWPDQIGQSLLRQRLQVRAATFVLRKT